MISVIVPVYNTEQYLGQCIDSILNSVYQDFELILVNDGSEDRCLDICRMYCERDCRVRLIDQEHTGVSAARNRGIEECHGEWVVFVDSDDFISEDFLGRITSEKYQDRDLLIYDFFRLRKKGKKAADSRMLSGGMIFEYTQKERDRLVRHFLSGSQLSERGNMSLLSLWAKVYKKAVLEKYNIRFPEELELGEDRIFNLEYLLRMQTCVYIQQTTYFAVMRADSAMHKYNPFFLRNDLRYQKKVKDILRKDGNFPKVKEAYYNSVLSCMADVLIKGIFHPHSDRSRKENYVLCEKMRRYRLYKQALKYNGKTGVIPRRMLLFFFRIRCDGAARLISKASYRILEFTGELGVR